MSSVKKAKTKVETVDTEKEVKVVETKVEETKKSETGFSVYIGPSITGIIQTSTIYPCSAKDALKLDEVKRATNLFTNVDKLIVDGTEVLDAMEKLNDKNSDYYKAIRNIKKK